MSEPSVLLAELAHVRRLLRKQKEKTGRARRSMELWRTRYEQVAAERDRLRGQLRWAMAEIEELQGSAARRRRESGRLAA